MALESIKGWQSKKIVILGISLQQADMSKIKDELGKLSGGPRFYVKRNGELVRLYERILIQRVKSFG